MYTQHFTYVIKITLNYLQYRLLIVWRAAASAGGSTCARDGDRTDSAGRTRELNRADDGHLSQYSGGAGHGELASHGHVTDAGAAVPSTAAVSDRAVPRSTEGSAIWT